MNIGLRNLSARMITIRNKSVIAKFSAANAIPDTLAPHVTEKEGDSGEAKELPILLGDKQEKLFSEIDLCGTRHWTQEQKEQVRQLFVEFGSLFTLDSLDLRKTSLVKHKIRLDEYTPFKERYCQMPPYLYEEVKKHLKEMLDIGTIRKSSSPWASAVVLIRKKDGSLRFCIDLRQLNARTIKDAYSLPCIEETLDCLAGHKFSHA